MRPRVSILNLLLVTTVVALVIVVLRLSRELGKERALRIQLLQKGGVLQVADPDAVHVVQVSSRREPDTLRWRIYVPEGRRVVLNTRLESVPADKTPTPRLPPNAIVVAARAPSNPVTLDAGESVITLHGGGDEPSYLKLDVVGSVQRRGRVFWDRDEQFGRFYTSSHDDLTSLEHTPAVMKTLREGRTQMLDDGKTFVLARFREPKWVPHLNGRPKNTIREALIWLHPDEP